MVEYKEFLQNDENAKSLSFRASVKYYRFTYKEKISNKKANEEYREFHGYEFNVKKSKASSRPKQSKKYHKEKIIIEKGRGGGDVIKRKNPYVHGSSKPFLYGDINSEFFRKNKRRIINYIKRIRLIAKGNFNGYVIEFI